MSIITLDFETPYGKGAREGHILHKYSLSSMTYEEYIRDPRFKVFGVSIKIDDGDIRYYSNEHPLGKTPEEILREIFTPGNDHTMIAHNTMFDGAILSWYYGLAAGTYWCTQAMSRALWNQRSSSLKQLCKSCYPDDESIRKTDELVQFANIYDLDEEQDAIMAGYCNNDVMITFECMKQLWKWMPDDELKVLDMTLKMFIHPAFVLDAPLVETFLAEYNAETDALIEKSGVARTTLASPAKFVRWVKDNLDLDIPIILSPTENDPDNTKFALSKDAMEFVSFQLEHPQYQHIWDARLRVASTIDRTRAERMLNHAAVGPLNPEGKLAAPLNYAAAHTLRWGGTNKINLQNLRRGSDLRRALKAPDGYSVIVRDLSNIEGRMNAWFCQELKMLAVFAAGGDLYNDFATKVFGYPVDRKLKAQDENGNYLDKNGNITTEDNAAEPMWTEGFVGKTCILGLGFQTGPAKLRNTIYLQSKKKVAFSLEQCKTIVYEDYRGMYTQIVKGWDDASFAIHKMYTLAEGEQFAWRCLTVERGRIRLPGGMYLNYPNLKVEMDEQGRPQYSYWQGAYRTNIYGGKLIENIIQALARKVIAAMILEVNDMLLANRDRFGGEARVVLTVHDEIVAIGLTEAAEEICELMKVIMSKVPDWCNDGTLVLESSGGFDTCYSK